jgi:phosphomannomutase
MGIFKSYDIRGVYGKEWDKGTAYSIGGALPGLLRGNEPAGSRGAGSGSREIVVGRDARLSSPEIFSAFTDGVRDAGASVTDIGLCDTPAVYFATAFYGFAGGVMITASHNPPEYNGLKVSGRDAVPVGYDTGLAELEKRVVGGAPTAKAGSRGDLRSLDIRSDYLSHLARFKSDISGVSSVIDCSNGTVGIYLKDVIAGIKGRFTLIFDEPDGRFPNHPPNPLVEENLAALKERVRAEKSDLGICFDGDADRVMFVDETGSFVSPDLIICLIGRYYFRDHRDRLSGSSSAVTYDVRSSRSVVECLRKMGGDPRICKVGHSHAKKLLRNTNGIFGGELAGHYYFRENYFCDSGMIAALVVLSVLSRERKPLSRLIAEVKKYYFSGEINFSVENGQEVVEKILSDYKGGKLEDIDGIRIDFPTWWFNLRRSNTEPLIRLVVEASTRGELAQRTEEIKEKIGKYGGH